MSVLTDRVGRIQPSATLAMTAKAAELKRNNLPVYNMRCNFLIIFSQYTS